jgi:actin-related protein 8
MKNAVTDWYKQVRKFNERVMGQEITEISDEEWTDVRHQPKFVIGHKAIWINPREPYELHWPIRRGRFAWSLAKISKEQVLADLESLWAEAIKQRLGVDPKDLKVCVSCLINQTTDPMAG